MKLPRPKSGFVAQFFCIHKSHEVMRLCEWSEIEIEILIDLWQILHFA